MPKYYVLGRSTALEPARWANSGSIVKLNPHLRGVFWITGALLDFPPPHHLEIELRPRDSRYPNVMVEYIPARMPIFRDDLIQALHEAGVDNLQLFDLTLIDPDDGTRYTNYKAVNILGAVEAADMKKSIATVHPGGALIDVDFDRLVIDENNTYGFYMFRLAESVDTILVHQKVKDQLIAKGFKGLKFYNPENVAT
jgi:hypothetical protein